MDIPDACTLPAAERPPRLAEFDALFATAVRAVEQITATHARFRLGGAVATVRDLVARESACCSFFTFTVTGDDEAVTLDIEVPPRYADVLASLVARAASLVGQGASPVGRVALPVSRVASPGGRAG